MQRLKSVCPECGQVFERVSSSAYCTDCKPEEDHWILRGKTTAQRGYGSRWQKLSKRARQLQPFCSDCGKEYDLTADHSTTAWQRHEAGKSIRLQDIDVVCIDCNSARGAARGESINPRRKIVEQNLDGVKVFGVVDYE